MTSSMRARGPIAVASLIAAAASAQQPDPGYVRTHVPQQNICLFWATRSFTHSADAAGYSKANVFPAYDAAYASWTAVAQSCSDYQIIKGNPIPNATVGYDPASGQNANVQIFREASCATVVPPGSACIDANTCQNDFRCWNGDDGTIALTTTTFSSTTGVIYDADTEFNAAPHADGSPAYTFTVVDSPPCDPVNQSQSCVATDVQETLTHETGHAFGLDHELYDVNSTMAPTAQIGEILKRTIDRGTALGFCTIYPTGQPSPPCDPTQTITRSVVAVSHGTPGLQGVGCAAAAGGSAGWIALALAALALKGSRKKLARRVRIRAE